MNSTSEVKVGNTKYMVNPVMIPLFCPWCGAFQQHGVHKGAILDLVCGGGLTSMVFKTDIKEWCRKPFRVEIDKKGNLKSITRLSELEKEPVGFSQPMGSSVNVEKLFGDFIIGNKANIMEIYNQTVGLIDSSKSVSEKQKTQAKGVLGYFRDFSPAVMPLIADIIKKTLAI